MLYIFILTVIYQLPSGKTIIISVEAYLSMSDEELMHCASMNIGYDNPDDNDNSNVAEDNPIEIISFDDDDININVNLNNLFLEDDDFPLI